MKNHEYSPSAKYHAFLNDENRRNSPFFFHPSLAVTISTHALHWNQKHLSIPFIYLFFTNSSHGKQLDKCWCSLRINTYFLYNTYKQKTVRPLSEASVRVRFERTSLLGLLGCDCTTYFKPDLQNGLKWLKFSGVEFKYLS